MFIYSIFYFFFLPESTVLHSLQMTLYFLISKSRLLVIYVTTVFFSSGIYKFHRRFFSIYTFYYCLLLQTYPYCLRIYEYKLDIYLSKLYTVFTFPSRFLQGRTWYKEKILTCFSSRQLGHFFRKWVSLFPLSQNVGH